MRRKKRLDMIKKMISLKSYLLRGEINAKYYDRILSKLSERQQK